MKPQNRERFGAAVLLLILLFVLSACLFPRAEWKQSAGEQPARINRAGRNRAAGNRAAGDTGRCRK